MKWAHVKSPYSAGHNSGRERQNLLFAANNKNVNFSFHVYTILKTDNWLHQIRDRVSDHKQTVILSIKEDGQATMQKCWRYTKTNVWMWQCYAKMYFYQMTIIFPFLLTLASCCTSTRCFVIYLYLQALRYTPNHWTVPSDYIVNYIYVYKHWHDVGFHWVGVGGERVFVFIRICAPSLSHCDVRPRTHTITNYMTSIYVGGYISV